MQAEQAAFLRDVLVAQLEKEHKATSRVITAIPSDKGDYRPDPKSKTAFELAWHLASAECYFLTGVSAGEFPKPDPRPDDIKTGADVTAWYAEMLPKYLETVKGLPGDQLLKDISFHGIFTTSGVEYLQICLVHSVHHRGQLSAYLRAMGSKVPSIYGPSADEEITAAAAS